MFPTTELKNHKLILKNTEKGFDKILLTESQYRGILSAIQAGQQFVTISEIGRTFRKSDIQDISKIKDSERNRMMSNSPITVQEDLYIVDNIVQKHHGESIWLEIRKQGEQILSAQKIIYALMQKGIIRKIYL